MELTLSSSILTATLTLIGGILLFVIQHLIIEVSVKPIQKQKMIIEDIAVSLISFDNLYSNPTNYGNLPSDSPVREKYMNASHKIRELAAQLKARSDNIPFYAVWTKAKYVLPKDKIQEVFGDLIGLSNSFGHEGKGLENSERADKIRGLLNIPSD